VLACGDASRSGIVSVHAQRTHGADSRSASLPVERMFRGFTVRGCSETMAGGTVAEGT